MKCIPRAVLAVLLLVASLSTTTLAAPKQLLIIGDNPDGHKPGAHEFLAGVRILGKLLDDVPDLNVKVVNGAESWSKGPDEIAKADGVVLFVSQGARWMQRGPRRYDALAKLAQRKGGIAALHWAIGAKEFKYVEKQLKVLGGSRGGPQRKYDYFHTKLHFPTPKHAIMTGLAPFEIRDEFYYRLELVKDPPITPLLSTQIKGRGPQETVAWAWERPDGGRSFGYVGFHYHENWQRPEYRRFAAQGVLWTLGLPIPAKGFDVAIDATELEVKKEDRPEKE